MVDVAVANRFHMAVLVCTYELGSKVQACPYLRVMLINRKFRVRASVLAGFGGQLAATKKFYPHIRLR